MPSTIFVPSGIDQARLQKFLQTKGLEGSRVEPARQQELKLTLPRELEEVSLPYRIGMATRRY